MGPTGNLQYVYRWRIGQWSTLAPCIEHNSPAFDADGLRWVFKLFKGRARNPQDLALYLSVHESTTDRLQQLRKKVDVSFTLENLRMRGLDYNKYTTPITVWVDSAYSTWGDDKFIGLTDMDSFIQDDMTCLVVRFHVRETIHEGLPPTAQPSPAIAVYIPEKIAAPFNQLLKSARFSDIQFELRDSSALILSPGPNSGQYSQQGLLSPRNSGDFQNVGQDALRINYSIDEILMHGQPSPPSSSPEGESRPLCITPMPGNCYPRALPYAQRPRIGTAKPDIQTIGPRYHAHKAILMEISPVFEAMFSNGMRETYEKVVEVWDVTPRAFERMLEFAYTHVCDLDPKATKYEDSVSAEEVVETLLCADQFEVKELREICWRNLMARLSTDTVWDIWSIATDLEAGEQQRSCKNFCCRRFTELCHSPSTMWASAHLLREVLSSDTLNVESEELLFETVVKWTNFREDTDIDVQSPKFPNGGRYSPGVGATQKIGTGRPASGASSVLSAEWHITRTGKNSDEAVLKCYRSPSNLSLLPPRSPWANLNRRAAVASPRRKPELTREGYTSALDSNAGRPSLLAESAPSPTSAITPSRLSVVSATRLCSSREFSEPLSALSANSSAWGSLSERKEFLGSLLPCIRFPMMDKNFLLRVVERNSDMMALPLMKDLLIEAYRFHAFNPPAPPPPTIQHALLQRPHSSAHRRSSEGYAKMEYTAQLQTAQPQYAKIILPLNTNDELALSRSQRRKQVHKLAIQSVNFSN
ncbi:hypothetical protein BX661DRAFT_77313 [Kickxella alabastrina]|uniref:uncharacterized protein n=1 Tax=Kickxella alabastrina TaxID=61397 RepID=UPI00221ECD6C|nr:uncharacterized protein BX661DRAFT_77313 [Kickxella alabastrina]KAI7833589.1 hypothetical protein BX661DRAFT_77313 [Kickxella alabastrina]